MDSNLTRKTSELPRSFWKWYDTKRRWYDKLYPNATDEERVAYAYNNWMEGAKR